MNLYTHLEKEISSLFMSGNLVIIGGRPGMGKTAFLLDLFKSGHRENSGANYFISLEAPSFQIFRLLTAKHTKISCEKLDFLPEIYEQLQQHEKDKLLLFRDQHREIYNLNGKEKYISFTPEKDFFSEIREFTKREHTVIFLDKLQMIPCDTNFDCCMQNLKLLALEKNITIVISSDLNTDVNKRQDHRPRITDFRNCETAAEYADVVMTLTRREYYDTMDEPSCAELTVHKNRYGQPKNIYLNFDKKIPEFSEYVPKIYKEIEY